MKDGNYYTVYGWMINRLKLKGTTLQLYAVIYGFSENGENECSGSLAYLAETTGCTKQTVLNALNKHRKKKFCSDACRLKWWYANSEKLNKKANYDCTCQFCGKVFVSYGNKNRKYCSRSCYGKSRRSLGQDHAVQSSGANFENASC